MVLSATVTVMPGETKVADGPLATGEPVHAGFREEVHGRARRRRAGHLGLVVVRSGGGSDPGDGRRRGGGGMNSTEPESQVTALRARASHAGRGRAAGRQAGDVIIAGLPDPRAWLGVVPPFSANADSSGSMPTASSSSSSPHWLGVVLSTLKSRESKTAFAPDVSQFSEPARPTPPATMLARSSIFAWNAPGVRVRRFPPSPAVPPAGSAVLPLIVEWLTARAELPSPASTSIRLRSRRRRPRWRCCRKPSSSAAGNPEPIRRRECRPARRRRRVRLRPPRQGVVDDRRGGDVERARGLGVDAASSSRRHPH